MSSPYRLLPIFGFLVICGCRETENVAPGASSDSSAVTVDSAKKASSDSIPRVSDSSTRVDTATRRIPQEASPEVLQVVEVAQRRLDSLKAHWEKTMANAGVLANFTKHGVDFPLPYGKASRSIVFRRFTELDGCTSDSMFNDFYEGGDVALGGMESDDFHMASGFALEGGLHEGMSRSEVVKILGNPYRDAEDCMAYAIQDWGEREYSNKVAWHETIRLFFHEGRLKAVWVIHPFYDC